MTLYPIPENPTPSPTTSEYSLTAPPIVSPYWGLDLESSARSTSTDNCSSDAALLKTSVPSSAGPSKLKTFFRKTRSKLSRLLNRIGLPHIPGFAKGDITDNTQSHDRRPGPIRAIYNDGGRSRLEVVYHDPSKLRVWGRRWNPLSRGWYVPGGK
ncbi:hypothetical protein B0T21DRAFT_432613 [Apiosordaria backusii]|uniref:Uncharacterized protein n=1 Tax=Apiosordaria backusii TaxID=314023 RepID=A0AA39ZPV9_9PEZI|nr:hypothetical protein B0T21DRAFT_432613 [Apiosordaria backusii]